MRADPAPQTELEPEDRAGLAADLLELRFGVVADEVLSRALGAGLELEHAEIGVLRQAEGNLDLRDRADAVLALLLALLEGELGFGGAVLERLAVAAPLSRAMGPGGGARGGEARRRGLSKGNAAVFR